MFPAGIYECEFKKGSVRHTAITELSVALLPDVVTLEMDLQTVDCSADASVKVTVAVTATIPVSTETFEVSWNYNGVNKPLVETRKANLQYLSKPAVLFSSGLF